MQENLWEFQITQDDIEKPCLKQKILVNASQCSSILVLGGAVYAKTERRALCRPLLTCWGRAHKHIRVQQGAKSLRGDRQIAELLGGHSKRAGFVCLLFRTEKLHSAWSSHWTLNCAYSSFTLNASLYPELPRQLSLCTLIHHASTCAMCVCLHTYILHTYIYTQMLHSAYLKKKTTVVFILGMKSLTFNSFR